MIHVHGSEGHMTESILNSTKEALGIEPDDTSFDNELVMHINSALMILYQLGVGDRIFQITGPDEKWDDFLKDYPAIPAVKSLLYYRVKLMFDSNNMSSGLIAEYNSKIKELEWRIYVAVDPSTNNELGSKKDE